MTQDEGLELQRLEVNISRLGDVISLQRTRIVELETELCLRQEELRSLPEKRLDGGGAPAGSADPRWDHHRGGVLHPTARR